MLLLLVIWQTYFPDPARIRPDAYFDLWFRVDAIKYAFFKADCQFCCVYER